MEHADDTRADVLGALALSRRLGPMEQVRESLFGIMSPFSFRERG
jgi:hypothetical protein